MNGHLPSENHVETKKEKPVREKWKNKIDFIFSIAGGFVGLGNVWRFPYLCYKNGGGAFLIPYVFFVIVGSLPIFFLEVCIGQYTSLGSSKAFQIVPIMKGLGIAVNLINFHLNVYYAVILAWSLRYFIASMSSELPWSTCNNTWNTPNCFDYKKGNEAIFHTTVQVINGTNITVKPAIVSSVTEYWERAVLNKSVGIEDIGTIQWDLFFCLLASWLVLYFCVWRGLEWTSKVVYFTATFPILMLFVLLVRGMTLDGAMDGVIFYLKPDLTRLSDYQVWLDAATQVFFSYALVKGMLVTMGSYNNYKYNSYRDCIFLSVLNSGVSLISGFAIFAVLGFMAKEQGVDIELVAESGPGLAFIAYPKALTLMPCPQFWGILFFFMLFLLGLDSEFVGLETMIACFVDLNPRFFAKPWRREIVLAILCTIQFLVGVTMVTNGGVYVLNIFDNYAAAGWSLLFLGFCECIAVAWLFGIDKFWDIVCDMIGFVPRFPLFKWCWAYITPFATTFLMAVMLAFYKPLTYNKTYVYPDWAIVICWLLTMSSVMWVPGYAAYQFFYKSKGRTWSEKWNESITSDYVSAGRAESLKLKDQAMASETPVECAPLYKDIMLDEKV